MFRRRGSLLSGISCIAVSLALPSPAWSAAAQEPQSSSGPRVLLNLSPRAIEYQLGRLTNDELLLVEHPHIGAH